MLVREVRAAGYRSLRDIRLTVDRLAVFVGANGVGKSNLYRALALIQAAAAGTLTREIAAEGGMNAAMWAGAALNVKPGEPGWATARRRHESPRVRLEVRLEDGASGATYEVEVGHPPPGSAAFDGEPQVKAERLTLHGGRRPLVALDRAGPAARALDGAGARREVARDLLPTETALGALGEAGDFPDLLPTRRALLSWRFHHELRTDAASPLRRPCLAVVTPSLAPDGADLAAVFATLAHVRQDTADLDRAVDDAFPGARLAVPIPEREARFCLVLPDLPKRVFEAHELSDGTLRYLALMGALLAYRPPPLIALNEPETSLHPSLIEPLARLIALASERSQVWLVTHSAPLAAALARHGGAVPRTVVKRGGATWIDGLRLAGDHDDEPDRGARTPAG